MIKILNFQIGLHKGRPFTEKVIKKAPRKLIGAEIGVLEGYHIREMIQTGNIKKIYLIDKDLSNLNYFSANTVDIEKPSGEAWKYIKEKIDFVYIDGDHSYKVVKNDIETYWQLIKKGGCICGHDFCYSSTAKGEGVIKAVTEFAVRNKLKLWVESPDWWIWKE